MLRSLGNATLDSPAVRQASPEKVASEILGCSAKACSRLNGLSNPCSRTLPVSSRAAIIAPWSGPYLTAPEHLRFPLPFVREGLAQLLLLLLGQVGRDDLEVVLL
jgi:hypothetical protein